MKTILITGATGGIGRHAALELVRQGHHVIATGRREAALVSLRDEARALKAGRLDVLRLDVTDEDAVARAPAEVDALTDDHGVDILVNNAGFGQLGPVETVSGASIRRQFETNVFGLVAMTRAFLPKMRARGQGRVVNVGSLGGRVTFPLMGVYNATKYAVESLSDALRNEVATFGVNVSIIEPGPIRTDFNEQAMATIDPSASDSAYGPVLARAERLRHAFEARASGPEVVTKAIVHAAFARRPRIRYVVPRSLSLFLALVAFLPTRLVDAVLRAASGLNRRAVERASAAAGV